MNNLTCTKCGTVSFGVTRQYAENEVKRFNEYFDALPEKEQVDFYGGRKAYIQFYERCWCGAHYSTFRAAKAGDCPEGCTLSPIIAETIK